jgi:hypothetical protein
VGNVLCIPAKEMMDPVPKFATVAYILAALAVFSLAAMIWYLLLHLTGMPGATIVDDAVTAVLDWALHLVL